MRLKLMLSSHFGRFFCGFTVLSLSSQIAFGDPLSPESVAKKWFLRMDGLSLQSADPELKEVADLLRANKRKEAGLKVVQNMHFLSTTIRPIASTLGTSDNSPTRKLDDFQALFLGVIRDDMDARTLLTGNLAYVLKDHVHNRTYKEADFAMPEPLDLSAESLVRVQPQWPDQPESEVAGLLSTVGWARAHLDAGTNRRATERSFSQFLCSPIETWRDFTVTDEYVGRDVDRTPSGDSGTYQTVCRGCHATMDGLRPAYARFDYVENAYVYLSEGPVAAKMNQKAHTFPAGYNVMSDEWENKSIYNYQSYFGWRGNTQGSGLNEFGKMLANSEAFSKCFAQRAFKETCRRAPKSSELPLVGKLASEFETDGYSVKKLFANTIASVDCL